MLTIKHIDVDGTETIMEADRVEVVRKNDRFSDGIFLDPDYGNPIIGRDAQARQQQAELAGQPTVPAGATSNAPSRRSFRNVIHFVNAPPSGTDCEARVYVMNRFGATVASYML